MTTFDGSGSAGPIEASRGGRSYLSIGEVLDALKEHFPDVTISKIRFFEAQGLLVPERTPSGYRKFYAADLDRLRTILAEQQERYVPLSAARSVAQAPIQPTAPSPAGPAPHGPPDEFFSPDDEGDDTDISDRESGSMYDGLDLGADRHPAQQVRGTRSGSSPAVGLRADAGHSTARRATVAPLRRVPSPRRDQPEREREWEREPAAGHSRTVHPPLDQNQPEREREPAAGHSRTVHPPLNHDEPLIESDTAAVFSVDELITATGATSALVDDATRQGFLHGRSVFGEAEFDDGDRRVLQSLVVFAAHGIDPRHVRVFLHAAQREADLYVQATLPLLRRRPRDGVNAEDPFRRFGDLERAGATLRTVVVRRALQQATEGIPGPVGR